MTLRNICTNRESIHASREIHSFGSSLWICATLHSFLDVYVSVDEQFFLKVTRRS